MLGDHLRIGAGDGVDGMEGDPPGFIRVLDHPSGQVIHFRRDLVGGDGAALEHPC